MFGKLQKEWVILGITLDDEVFNYPDWADRLCGMLADQSSSQRLGYSNLLRPMHVDGVPAVVVNADLEKADPKAFDMVRQFAQENRLKVRSGRTRHQLAETTKHRAVGEERRDLCARRGS